MAILRILFGSVASGVLRLAVIAGVLFLCYLFIIKPAIDKTSEAFHSSGLDQIGKSLQGVGPQIEREVKRSLGLIKAHGGSPQRLLHCIQHAKQDVHEIERCTRRF